MQSLFAQHRPEIVAHAAAHKHVPMAESHPCKAIKNNVLATRVLAELAGEAGVEWLILIPSDKAVRPTSVMGASKRVTSWWYRSWIGATRRAMWRCASAT